jgi:Transposase
VSFTTIVFFEPVELNLELADLLIELRSQCLFVLRGPRPARGEGFGQGGEGLLLPLRHQVGVDAVGGSDLIDRALPFDGFERDPGFELSAVVITLFFHPIPLGVGSNFTTLRAGPNFGVHHRLREKLTRIFETEHTKESARRALRRWMAEVSRSRVNCFDTFLRTFENWMDEITNYFPSRLTSGWVEGFNNKIKVLKRRCYGLPSPASLFRRIWLDLHGIDAFAY